MTARVEAICVKRAHRGPMDTVPRARLRAGHGIVGDANRSRFRQVTIIEREVWEALMRETGADARPLDLSRESPGQRYTAGEYAGRVLRVGSVRLQIAGETKPCERMEEAVPGLQAAMRPNWRGAPMRRCSTRVKLRWGTK